MEDYKFLFKIVLVGNAGVGKTCLVRRFTQGLFPPGQGATIGVDFMIKTVEVEGEKIKLQIWDTAGQERFRSITQSYYRSAHALILVYDISCQPTFDCLPDWLREIQEYANSKVLKILVGNKTDRDDREIPTQIGEEFAKQHDMYFLETSAKEAENVERLFYEIAAELIDQARSKDGTNLSKTTVDSIGLGNFGAKGTQNSCCSSFSSTSCQQTTSENSVSRNNT
ncbi:ras-related protein Rab-30 [Eurosta solidaginis]|uniref:ras-related protein Rab-30 n=1 Tax=Eurosta solidaginis TaxID=178769 RepID=UPI003530E875